jgi:hypothetical protein
VTEAEAIKQLRMLALSRAIGRFIGSDQLIQVGLDALLAGVDTPSLPLLAGLGRREEPEAPELFDQVMEELGFTHELPHGSTARRWAVAYILAEQIANGFLDPATGADLMWAEAAIDLGYPEALQPIVQCAVELADWDEEWSTPLDEIKGQVLDAVRELLSNRPQTA